MVAEFKKIYGKNLISKCKYFFILIILSKFSASDNVSNFSPMETDLLLMVFLSTYVIPTTAFSSVAVA